MCLKFKLFQYYPSYKLFVTLVKNNIRRKMILKTVGDMSFHFTAQIWWRSRNYASYYKNEQPAVRLTAWLPLSYTLTLPLVISWETHSEPESKLSMSSWKHQFHLSSPHFCKHKMTLQCPSSAPCYISFFSLIGLICGAQSQFLFQVSSSTRKLNHVHKTTFIIFTKISNEYFHLCFLRVNKANVSMYDTNSHVYHHYPSSWQRPK